MYDRSQERDVFVASLPFMDAAKAQALARGMNDHGPLHAHRVHALVGRLGALVALSTYEYDLLHAAALLHDIGMAKGRDDHHIISAELVQALVAEGKLPFSDEEADVVSTLCKWHRREYEADAVHKGLCVRTGVLASLLRLADAMDLDYRRAEDYPRLESVIANVHNNQVQHHLSVRNILGVRLHASHMGIELQLLIDQMSHAKLQLDRLIEELVGTPIAWPVKIIPVRGNSPVGRAFNTQRRAVVFSYCNAHGIVQAGMSKRALEMTGFATTVVCDMDSTGYPPRFWEKIIPQDNFEDVQMVAILGLNLPHDIEQFLGLVRSYPSCRWFYATPLEQSSEKVAALLDAGVDVLVGDARLLFVGDALAEDAGQWTKIAGLCNADDWLSSSASFSRKEFFAARGLRLELLKLVESKACREGYGLLIDRVASGALESFIVEESLWTTTMDALMPTTVSCHGRVVILEGDSFLGRFKYDLAHQAIEHQGTRPWDQNEFSTPYAICRATLSDGRERVLYLSRFSRLEGAVPVKYFVPSNEYQLGSGATIWHTYASREAADVAIHATVQGINGFFSCQN